MNLHINYETVEPYPLDQLTTIYALASVEVYRLYEKARLKANKEKGTIIIDGFDELEGIPKEAWDYKLGNRSALEWILDQYKEKKPKDPTIWQWVAGSFSRKKYYCNQANVNRYTKQTTSHLFRYTLC